MSEQVDGRLVLETARTQLRELWLTDVTALSRIYGNADVMTNSIYGICDSDRVQRILTQQQQHYREHGFGLWGVVLSASGAFIGCAGIEIKQIETDLKPTLVYRFHPQVWGQGIATEVVTAVIAHGFCVLQLTELWALIKPDNQASRQVAEKCGLHLIGTTCYLQNELEVFSIASVQEQNAPSLSNHS